MYEALLHSRKHPSEAADIGNIKRSNVQILHRTLSSISAKNEEISATMAAFCLLDMPSSMSSRKFWFAFLRPAVAMQRKLFPLEAVRPSRIAKSAKNLKAPSIGNGHDSSTENSSDSDLDSDDENIRAPDFDITKQRDAMSDSSCSDEMDVPQSMPKFVPEREDFVINFSSTDENGDDQDGSSDIIRKKNGTLAVIEQHDDYKYRGPGLREFNLDEYEALVTRVPKRNDVTAVQEADDDSDGDVSDKELGNGDDLPKAAAAGSRKRNGTFPFAPQHPLSDSHEQRLRSDPRIVQIGGRAIPCFPGPMVADSPSWNRAAQAFAEFMVVFLCPWNPTTFHPERFDEATGTYVDVPMNWNGLCDWIEILYQRAADMQKTADLRSIDPETKKIRRDPETNELQLAEVDDPKIWLSARLFRFRNLASGLRTTVGLRNSNVFFRHQASTRWNNANRRLIDPSEADLCGAVVEQVDHAGSEQMAREVDMAIKWVEDRVASMHDDSDSTISKQKRAHGAAVAILEDLCACEEVIPRSTNAVSCVIPEHDLRQITQKLQKPSESLPDVHKMDADDESSNGSVPFDNVLPPDASSAQCTEEQAAALKIVLDWLQAQLQHEGGGHSTKVPIVPKLLIHGPGGTL